MIPEYLTPHLEYRPTESDAAHARRLHVGRDDNLPTAVGWWTRRSLVSLPANRTDRTPLSMIETGGLLFVGVQTMNDIRSQMRGASLAEHPWGDLSGYSISFESAPMRFTIGSLRIVQCGPRECPALAPPGSGRFLISGAAYYNLKVAGATISLWMDGDAEAVQIDTAGR